MGRPWGHANLRTSARLPWTLALGRHDRPLAPKAPPTDSSMPAPLRVLLVHPASPVCVAVQGLGTEPAERTLVSTSASA